jgi:hypothetical protein
MWTRHSVAPDGKNRYLLRSMAVVGQAGKRLIRMRFGEQYVFGDNQCLKNGSEYKVMKWTKQRNYLKR